MIEVAGTVDDTVNFNRASQHPAEYKVGFEHEDPIPRVAEGSISGNAATMWVMPETADSTIELFDESGRSPRAVLSDEIQDAYEVFLGRREIANSKLSAHRDAV